MELTAKLQKLVSRSPDGVVRALAEINEGRQHHMGAQVLNNKLNPNYEQDCLNLLQFEAIVRRLDLNLELAKHFAAKANAVVVQLPSVPESDMAILDDFLTIAKELGETSQRFQQGFSDGEISENEFRDISKEVDDTVEALLKFKKSVERVVR